MESLNKKEKFKNAIDGNVFAIDEFLVDKNMRGSCIRGYMS